MTSTSTRTEPPLADCIADSAGGVTFDIVGDAPPGAVLVLRRRGGKTTADLMRLPLTPAGEGRSRAVLPSTVELAEGRWDAFTTYGDESVEQRIEPGIRDLRSLVDRAPDPGRAVVAVRIPYPTADGKLAVRSWLRAPHAEAGDITFGQGAMTLEGRLYGAGLGGGAAAEARLRGAKKAVVHRVPATVRQDGTFTFTLAYEPLAEGRGDEQRLWDLWLCPAGAEPRQAAGIRVGRILDDVWEKKGVFRYPVLPVEGPKVTRPTTAYPYFTVDNDLSVRLDTVR